MTAFRNVDIGAERPDVGAKLTRRFAVRNVRYPNLRS